MAEIKQFQGFFSYAHHDADTDPKLVDALTIRLEKRVSARLTNARFSIWQDVNIRTGERWDDRIGAAVRTSQVFIILLTPKWYECAYCLQEYQIFQEVEDHFEVGEYVAPLLARTIDRQVENFDQAQKEVYDSLKSRQYKKTIATEFLALAEDQRETFIDLIADDIEGMIERLRKKPSPSNTNRAPIARKTKPPPEFDSRPHNFAEVDFVSAAEVSVEPPKGDEPRSVFAHLSFVERLYVQSMIGRVEFSVHRAFLSLDDGGTGKLKRNEEWAHFSTSGSVYYINSLTAPYAITVCIDPEAGRTGLSALPLPPAGNENFLSKPAIAAPDIDVSSIQAHLTVSLSPEGLFIVGEDHRKPSPKVAKKIAAIMSTFIEKNASVGNSEVMRRVVPVRERTR